MPLHTSDAAAACAPPRPSPPQHYDACPLCMNRRYIVCGDCGGHYHRPLFRHARRLAGGSLAEVTEAYTPAAAGSGSSMEVSSARND